jgi:hypothetical protein
MHRAKARVWFWRVSAIVWQGDRPENKLGRHPSLKSNRNWERGEGRLCARRGKGFGVYNFI